MSEIGYYRFATIHGDNIVFVCEDDLWLVTTDGGVARRLTVSAGLCSFPRFSPDGRHIAFVSNEEGHPEVYVMPAEGGAARRLTFLGADTCYVSGWTADGSEILFISDARSPFFKHSEGFEVSAKGGAPVSLKLGHMKSIAVAAGGATVIGRNSIDPATWKRYRGGTAGELWIDASGNGKFQSLISLEGNLVCPLWIGNRIYFLSDHEGIGNIYSCRSDGTDLRRHTDETEYFVRFPATDGQRIVYTAGGDLLLYDPAAHRKERVEVAIRAASSKWGRKFYPGSETLEHFAPHPQGHSLALITRGQPFTMANWEGAVIQHGGGSKIRYRNIEWLADGKRFVVVNDRSGRECLEVHHADQSEEPFAATHEDIGRVTEMAVNPVRDLVALANQRHEMLLVDVAARKVKVVDRSPADRVQQLAWSPDGRWVAYSYAPYPDTTNLRVADADSLKTHDVTRPLRQDGCPVFDPEGNYLYFLSTRDFNPVYDELQFDLSFPQARRPYLVTLREDVVSPFVPKARPLVRTETEAKDDTKPVEVKIDFDGIADRVLAFPVEEGRYEQLVACRGRVLYTQMRVKGIRPGETWWSKKPELGTLIAFDFEELRACPYEREVGQMRLALDNRTLVYRAHDKLRVIDAGEKLADERADRKVGEEPGRKSGFVDLLRVNVLVVPRDEWSQMFDEAWRLQGEHFWDENMSAIDWGLVHRRYASLVPRLNSRSELSDLIWEMQGELGTSHAYEFGGDYRQIPSYRLGFLGADLSFDPQKRGYRIDRIIRGDSWNPDADSPLALPGIGIEEGDVIVAVSGRPVDVDCSVDELLVNSAGKDVSLTVIDRRGQKRAAVVRVLKEERSLRYRNWVEANRALVHKRTGGKVGYVHIPDMGPWGFAEFHRSYLCELNRDGLIVDARYNRGGHVSSLLLEKLLRKRVGYCVPRWGMPMPYPPESVMGPMVALTNQFAGSDGDIFSHCFKIYGLGPLVGKRTWGGVIGIWPRHALVDGTLTTQPEFSFWFKDVQWRVENYGTDPDVVVDIAPHEYAQGEDPQLMKALDLIEESLRKLPVRLPDFNERPKLALPSPATASRR